MTPLLAYYELLSPHLWHQPGSVASQPSQSVRPRQDSDEDWSTALSDQTQSSSLQPLTCPHSIRALIISQRTGNDLAVVVKNAICPHVAISRPVESHSGDGENILAGFL